MWGIISERHFMKVNPFMVRLDAATGALNNAVDQCNVEEMARGLEDVGFWTARTVSEMISGSDQADTPAHIQLFKKGVAALFQAQAANVRARKALRQMLTPTTYQAPSSIPNAGNGAFANVSFRPGDTVGVLREDVKYTGNQMNDLGIIGGNASSFTPLLRTLNHSPHPNLQVMRMNDAPVLVGVAKNGIARDEELTVDYLDPGLPEAQLYPMNIPPEWNHNALMAKKVTDLSASAKMSIGLVIGPLLLLASEQVQSPWSTVLAVGGGTTSAWALFQWLKQREP